MGRCGAIANLNVILGWSFIGLDDFMFMRTIQYFSIMNQDLFFTSSVFKIEVSKSKVFTVESRLGTAPIAIVTTRQ